MFRYRRECTYHVKICRGSGSQRNVPSACRFSRGRQDKLHTENCRRRIEELRAIVQAEAAQWRLKEYEDKAAERGMNRTKSSPEEGQTDAPTTAAVQAEGDSGLMFYSIKWLCGQHVTSGQKPHAA